MTTDDSFLQAIRAEPDDDAVRLIYADWLQEQDDPARVERGEFIRVQCELARLSPGDSRRVALEVREEALLSRNWQEWVGPLRDLVGESSWQPWKAFGRQASKRFWRGFVEDLTLPTPLFLARAAELFRLTPLRWLGLTGAGSHAAALAGCPYLAELQALHFVDYYVDPLDAVSARHLAASANLHRLRVLNLYSNNLGQDGVEALTGAPWLGHLTDLHLGSCGIGDGGVEALAASPHLSELRSLDLSQNGITDQGAHALAHSLALFRLRKLELSSNLITAEGRRELLHLPLLGSGFGLGLLRNPCTA